MIEGVICPSGSNGGLQGQPNPEQADGFVELFAISAVAYVHKSVAKEQKMRVILQLISGIN